jgi:UTP--glucose-1-phosphate uridylyltransferase
LDGITAQQLEFLRSFSFDENRQRRWQRELRTGRLSRETNVVAGPLLAPPPGTVQSLPAAETKANRRLEQLGKEALARGEVGVVVLNGGMATRFGGVVKGLVPVLGATRTFVDLVVEDALQQRERHGGRVPLFFMNSFATDAATRDHFRDLDDLDAEPGTIEHFTQSIALRMTDDGKLFRLEDGAPSFYGPGHGDFLSAFRASGALARFVAAGGRWLLVRNVDNLGARIDPIVIGHHIASGAELTVELAPKWPDDVGGSPFLLDGRTQLVEQLRYPADFDPNIVDVFNTNTFTFTAAALDRAFDLGWYYVEKQVEGRTAVQVEHLLGEASASLRTNWLQVRRAGRRTRFLPIKTPEDLSAARDEVADMYDGADDD